MPSTHRPGNYPPEQRSAAFDEFAERWLLFTYPIKPMGTPALLIFQQFQSWCEERFGDAFVIGRTEFYRQIERRYSSLGAERYTTHGLYAYHYLRLRRRPLSQHAIDSEKMAMEYLPEEPSRLPPRLPPIESAPLVLRKQPVHRLSTLREEAADIQRLLERAEQRRRESS